MGLQQGRSVQPLSGPRAVTRSHPNPKSRSYESLFFFSSPAWTPLYSFLFQANERAVKEPCIPLDNLGQAWPGCSSSIKRSFSCLSFPVPWYPNWRLCTLLPGLGWGTGVPPAWCPGSAPAEGVDVPWQCRRQPSHSVAPLAPFCFHSGRGNTFPFA